MTRASRFVQLASLYRVLGGPYSCVDPFTRADSASTLGSPWTAHNGTWGISSNQGYVASGAADNQASVPVRSGASGVVACRIKPDAFGVGVLCRVTDQDNWILFQVDAPGSVQKAQLYRRQAGGYNLISEVNYAYDRTQFYDFELRWNGSSLVGFINGAQVLTGTDGAFTTIANAGIRAYGATAARFDDFRAA